MVEASFDSSGMSPQMQGLIAEVLADDFWSLILREFRITLDAFDPGIGEQIGGNPLECCKMRNLVRYCIPLFELYEAIDGVKPQATWLAGMYLWQEAWRPLDNLIDSDGSFHVNFKEYNIYILRAWTFHSKIFPSGNLMSQFLECLDDTLDVETSAVERVNPSLIYKRARLFEVVLQSLPGLSDHTRDSFRSYLNTVTIAHDFGDIATDIRDGNLTFSTATLKSIDDHCRLSSSQYSRLQEVHEEAFRCQYAALESEALRSCWITHRNVDSFFNWAFRN